MKSRPTVSGSYSLKFLLSAAMFVMGATISASCQPSVYWHSDPIRPGETLLISGGDLSEVEAVNIRLRRRDGDIAVMRAAEVSHTNTEIKAQLPIDLGSEPFEIELRFNGGNGSIVRDVNSATTYWLQGDLGDQASAGGWIRIFGRNMASGNGILELQDQKGEVRRLQAKFISEWELRFSIPEALGPGVYSATLLTGTLSGSSRSIGALRVLATSGRIEARHDVRSLGAAGDGVRDDGPIIREALARAKRRGGGTVFLPQGRYRIVGSLTIPDYVRLVGQDRELVSLVWAPEDNPPEVMIEGYAHFALENVTVVAPKHWHIIRGGFPSPDRVSDGEDIALFRVRVRANEFLGHITPEESAVRFRALLQKAKDGVHLVGLAGKNLRIEDCDIYGSGISIALFRANGAYVSNNAFYHGRRGWYSISGGHNVIFEGNTIQAADMEATGGGINTLFAKVAHSDNVAFLNNTIRGTLGWDGEALTTDGPGGFYYGSVQYDELSEQAKITLVDQITERADFPDWTGAGVFIIRGRGFGQYARIAARRGREVFLDAPFAIKPDTSSVISLTPLQEHYIIVQNKFVDCGLAVQFYGTAVDSIIAENHSTRTAGFAVKALIYQHPQPSWFNQLIANTIETPDPLHGAAIALWGDGTQDCLNYGAIVRGNNLKAGSWIELRGSKSGPGGVCQPIIEDNKLSEGMSAIKLFGSVDGATIRENSHELR